MTKEESNSLNHGRMYVAGVALLLCELDGFTLILIAITAVLLLVLLLELWD